MYDNSIPLHHTAIEANSLEQKERRYDIITDKEW